MNSVRMRVNGRIGRSGRGRGNNCVGVSYYVIMVDGESEEEAVKEVGRETEMQVEEGQGET